MIQLTAVMYLTLKSVNGALNRCNCVFPYLPVPVSSLNVGTAPLLAQHPSLLHETALLSPTDKLCRKDIGQSKRLRKWSRGHQFVVRGGGHIDAWQPLYRYIM